MRLGGYWWQSEDATRGGFARSGYCYRCCCPSGGTIALAQNPIISAIQIEGNQRVEDDAIRLHISQRAGEPLNRDAVSNDIKSIYQMGFFQNVIAETRNQNGKEVLVYKVIERPQITDVKIAGMKEIRPTDDKIIAAMKMHPGSIMDPARVDETKKGDQGSIREQGLLPTPRSTIANNSAPTTPRSEPSSSPKAPRSTSREVDFTGNHAFTARELRGQMDTAQLHPAAEPDHQRGRARQEEAAR